MANLLESQLRFARGEEEGFAELTRQSRPMIYRLLRRLLENPTDAEDVLQDTYLRAYAFLATARFREEASVRTWLYRIATNGALDLLRRQRHRAQTPPPAELAPSPEAQVEARLSLARLHALLAGLPPEQRAALILKELEGLSSAEVGRVLACSEGAVEQRLVRARRYLKEREEHRD
jgi:RNA polymerase sigma-70 factor (ECF subfamily)